ncbi:MAG: uncharacterized protein QOD94_2953, partial [Alphaproteobacteria bacterium]|nr:uncharacterized protein [Alphaproteobacteria bacterium]
MSARLLAVLFAAWLVMPAQAQTKPPAKPAPKSMATPTPSPPPEGDVAYGAYQRGNYLTALVEATKRMEENNDPKAMALLAELYANGLGVSMNDAKAAE